MSDPTNSGTIRCQSCGHENDPTRVFCHSCGVRLERPEGSVAEIEEKTREADRKAAAARRGTLAPKRKKGPSPLAWAVGAVFSLLRIAVLAALLAVLILLFRMPDGIPPEKAGDAEAAAALGTELANAAASRFPAQWVVTQDQLNNFLTERVEIVGGRIPGLAALEGKRTYVVLEQGRFSSGVEYGLLGLRVYVYTDFEVRSASGGLQAVPVSGGIGRLSLPASAFHGFFRWYDSLAESLAGPLEQLASANSIDIQPGEARLNWSGSRAGAP